MACQRDTNRVENAKKLLMQHPLKIFFVGIGGVSMSSLASLAIYRGMDVVGSDIKDGESIVSLRKFGAEIYIGHSIKNIIDSSPDICVYSFAASNSVEVNYCITQGIPTLSRAEYMGIILSEYKFRIGVSGSHGKSTVTALIAEVLTASKLEPTVLSGAKTLAGRELVVGKNEYSVFEACEYRNAFLSFSPSVAIILNVELDHVDFFMSYEEILDSFIMYANSAERFALVNYDDEGLMRASHRINKPFYTVGKGAGADYRFLESYIGSEHNVKVFFRGSAIASVNTRLQGEHNAYNLAYSIAIAHIMGVLNQGVLKALENFQTIPGRLEVISRFGKSDIICDYAHHPTEIKASLKALAQAGYKSTAVIFAPHTFSRTIAFFNEFSEALSMAELCIILNIYPAREVDDGRVNSKMLCDRINELGGRAFYIPEGEIPRLIMEYSFDSVVLMGAGDISGVRKLFIK